MQSFTLKQLFKKSYETLMGRKVLYFGVTIICVVILMMLDKLSQSYSVVTSTIGTIALILFQFLIAIGSTQFILRDIKKESVTYNDFFPSNEVLIRYAKTTLRFLLKLLPIIAVLMISMLGGAWGIFGGKGVLALVSGVVLAVASVCAVYFIVKYYFFGYIIVEEVISSKDALTRAREMTKGKMWKLFGLMLLVGFLNFLGGITFIGWVFTMPFSMILVGHVYSILKNVEAQPLQTNELQTQNNIE